MDPVEALRMHGVGGGKKPTGNALSADVRAGKTYSSAEGYDKEGTMPVRSLVAQTITPGVNNITKQAGIYDGDITIEGDPDLVAANIMSGKNIFGVAGNFAGKRAASGTVNNIANSFNITGLSFTPSKVMYFLYQTGGYLYAIGVASSDGDIYTGDGITKNAFMGLSSGLSISALKGNPTFALGSVTGLVLGSTASNYKWFVYE